MNPQANEPHMPATPNQPSPNLQPQAPRVFESTQPAPAPSPQPVVSAEPVYAVQPQAPQAQPVVMTSPTYPVAPPRPKRKRRLVIASVAGIVLLLLLVGGFVFGYYLPNKPENVWNRGLDRTGTALSSLVTDATEQKRLQAFTSSQFAGTFSATGDGFSYSGTLGSTYDAKSSDSSFSFESDSTDTAKKALDIQILTQLVDDNDYPDVYFKATGLAALGLDAFMPTIPQYDGKWISVTSSYLESLAPTDQEKPSKDKFSANDAAALTRVVTDKTQEYIFTSDTEKSVLVRKDFIGQESLEGGVTANHYTATLNKAHAKDYCKSLVEALVVTDAYKRLPWVDANDIDSQATIKDCQNYMDDEIDETETFDVWIDKKYALINKLRFTEKDDKGNYVEIGQTYDKTETLPVFMKFHSDKSEYDGKLTLQLNTKTNQTKGEFKLASTGKFKVKVNATFEFKPYEGEVKIVPPTNAIPIQDLLEAVGLNTRQAAGAAARQTPLGNKAADAERTTDLKALQGQIEASYAQTGGYPSLAQINSASWRNTNMRGLDLLALQDPSGTTPVLAVLATTGQYGYSPTGCNATGTQCQSYSLTANLSTGVKLTLTSLN